MSEVQKTRAFEETHHFAEHFAVSILAIGFEDIGRLKGGPRLDNERKAFACEQILASA